MTPLRLDGTHISFRYPDADSSVLIGLNVALAAGQMGAIIGPSGSGKSTVLYILGLLLKPCDGDVQIDGRSTKSLADPDRSRIRASKIGFVFQEAHLDPDLTAIDNVVDGLIHAGEGWREAKQRATAVMQQYGLEHVADHRPQALSGGEAQRVALCRAVAKRPAIILADEPTGSLDATNGRVVEEGLRDYASEGAAVLIVTHNESLAARSDAIWRLEGSTASER